MSVRIKDLNRKITFARNFKIDISISVSLIWLVILLSLPYLMWEAYWALKVGYPFIKWHTHLMLFFYLWVLGYLFWGLARKLAPKLSAGALIFYTAVLVALFIGESYLLLFKIKETTYEKLSGGYGSWYDSSHDNWYRTTESDKPRWITKAEYSYIRMPNSLGFSDIEWPVSKRVNEKRILSLGDSFTEGDGAPYDSCYVTQLGNKLKALDSNAYIMNAGICGCDPFINYVNYRDRLFKYKPDLILQTLSSGDVNVDIIVRGGMERFKAGGKVQYRKSPWWEPIYAISNLSRLYFSALGYDQLLMTSTYADENKKYLDSIVVDLFKQYAALAQANNCKLVVILQPFLGEIEANKYQYDLSVIVGELKKINNIQICDLMPFYQSYAKSHHKAAAYYYWPIDAHHNSRGYTMMAEGIYPYAAAK